MYRLRSFVNQSTLKNIYYSLINFHILYAILVWGSACETELNNNIILQKKAIWMTLTDQYPKIASQLNLTDPFFVKLDILKVPNLYKFQLSKFIYECLALSSPSNFCD